MVLLSINFNIVINSLVKKSLLLLSKLNVDSEDITNSKLEFNDFDLPEKVTDSNVVDQEAVINNELTVKRYKTNGKKIVLEPENPKYKPVTVEKETEGYIWGVVTNVIHEL